MDNKLPEILKARRKELNLTLKEIGKKIGVTEATVQRWESGATENLRYNRLIKLAKVLEVKPSFLMGFEDAPQNAKEKELLEIYQKAKESDKAEVKTLLKIVDKLLGIDEP